MTQVKLNSFRIQNYRSIIDSGWKNLAPDNITILIGQNESGKTTVLEALESFYKGSIIDDILRSDQTLPVVSCSFSIEGGQSLIDFLNEKKLPSSLVSKIKNKKNFTLTRQWHEDKSSRVFVSGEELFDFFNKQDKETEKTEASTIKQVYEYLTDANKYQVQLAECSEEKSIEEELLTEKRKNFEASKKNARKARKPDSKVIAEKELEIARKEYDEQEKLYLKKAELYEQIKEKSVGLSEKIKVSKACLDVLEESEVLEQKLKEKQHEVLDFRQLVELSTNIKDRKKNHLRLEKATIEVQVLTEKQKQISEHRKLLLLVAHKVINEDSRTRSAEQSAKRELDEISQLYNLSSLGKILMNIVPVFEFFEDFSGLLPNKIDLEDILNEKEHTEGYLAAKNYLQLAGLNGAFFREKNQRILKQRIESLNSDVTINFQDYWSQQVGKNSKIKLHFELEHYDYTYPDKSGKPYIEFWIKDKQNRLYPKQRSRGVRWFLSFYLELKATEARGSGNRVLLIDEPGLSLHARAQEDVLKVFEDLKDSMQIIYCTHSPHLVKTEKLYRVLAVQRANENDDRSETLIFDPSGLNIASADTLTPIYSTMGIRLNSTQFINKERNILLPDAVTYYYLHWLAKMIPDASDINFIPATNENSVPLLINIMAGWQVNFSVLLFGSSRIIESERLEETLLSNIEGKHEKMLVLNELESIEDVFSTLDFKKFILFKREGITEKNSEYILSNGLSRKVLATNFVNSLNNNKPNLNIFDETTQKNITDLFNKLSNLINT
jgi:predicted ATP-dependent endonuclease of OLD family